MHFMNSVSALVAASTTQTTAAKASSSSSSSAFLFLIVIVAIGYFVLIRPSRNRRMAAMRQSKLFDLGDEVIAGGMVGHVVRLGDGDVDIEVADGVVVTFVNQAVQSRAAYNARTAPRGGARGFGARGRTAGTDGRPAHEADAWPAEDDEADGDDLALGPGGGDDGDTGEPGGTAHGDGGVEPTGGDR